jgi:O-antigen/teichoic acid export membrane protein
MDKDFKQNFLRGSILTSGGQLLSIVVHFISVIILARTIPKEDFGTFSLLTASWIFLQLFGGLGLDLTLVKYLSAEEKVKWNKIFSDFLFIKMTSVFFFSLVFLLLSNAVLIIDQTIKVYSYYITAIFILGSLRDFFNAQLQGIKNFKELALIQISTASFRLLVYILGIAINTLDLVYLMYAEISSLIFSFLLQQYLVPIKFRFSYPIKLSNVSKVLKFALPLYFNNLLAVVNNRSNSFIIAAFSDVLNLAYYDVAKRLPDALNRISSSFTLVFFPNISDLFAQKKVTDARLLLEKSIFSIALIISPIILITYLFGDEIIILIFSEKYLESSFALFLFTFSLYFGLISILCGYSIVSAGHSFLSFKINLFATIIGFTASIILTPIYGFKGAVISILLLKVSSWILGLLKLKKFSLEINIIKTLYPLLLCVPFILLSELFFGRDQNILISFLFMALYFVLEIKIFNDFLPLIKTIIISFKNFSKGR